MFVVYKIIYNGDLMPMNYIGSTSKLKVNNGYMGSIKSKKWKGIYYSELENNRQLFTIEILHTVNDRKQALELELIEQKKFDVVKNIEYINQSFASVDGYFGRDVTGDSNPMHGRTNEVIALDLVTNEKVRISKDKFDSSDRYVGHSNGMVSVIEKNTNNILRVTTEYYKNNKETLIHWNNGTKVSKKTKRLLSSQRQKTTTYIDWFGIKFRANNIDIRTIDGSCTGVTATKKYIIIDNEDNVFYVMNIVKFFEYKKMIAPTKKEYSLGTIKIKRKKYRDLLNCPNGWTIKTITL